MSKTYLKSDHFNGGGSVLQGAFILAKAKGGAEIAAASIHHLHRYIELLFEPAKRRGKEIS
jgi:hypothetical protein